MTEHPAIDAVVETVARGGVVALPTDTVYGIGAAPTSAAATERLFALKGRAETTSIAVLVADASAARALVTGPLDAFDALAGAFWPGALTIVMPRHRDVRYFLGTDDQTIGVRTPASVLARAVLERTGPLAVTSANHSGEPPATTADVVAAIFGDAVTILDGGRCSAPPSTVVSLVAGGVAVLRHGSITESAIADALGRR